MKLWSTFATTLISTALESACSPAQQITETAWKPSPNGEWLTSISRSDTAGPGINSLYETVRLKRRSAEKGEGVEILTIDEGDVLPAELNGSPVITIRWRDQTHVELSYRAGKVIFRVAQIADLFVQTRPLR